MTLTARTYEERTSLIKCAIDALVHAKTDDLDIAFTNGYTVGIHVHDEPFEPKSTATVAIVRNRKDLTDSDFICDCPREFNASELQALLCNISRATNDFECGFAYARYIARTHE